MDFLLVGLGGFVGANARFVLIGWLLERLGGQFPYGTLVVNVVGSLAIGLLLGVIVSRADLDPAWRLLLVTGFLGGFTTFSSYAWETMALAETGRWGAAALYVLASNGLSLVSAALGLLAARALVH